MSGFIGRRLAASSSPECQRRVRAASRVSAALLLFPAMLLSASLSRLGSVHSDSECACIFGALPPQRLSPSLSPVEPRRSCQCPLWLKTTALILRQITTAILTDFPADVRASEHKHNLAPLLLWRWEKKTTTSLVVCLLAAVFSTCDVVTQFIKRYVDSIGTDQ